MNQTTAVPIVQRTKKISIGIGSSSYARMGDRPVKILVTKLARPSAVAEKSTGKMSACDTYRMLKADETPSFATNMKNGNI